VPSRRRCPDPSAPLGAIRQHRSQMVNYVKKYMLEYSRKKKRDPTESLYDNDSDFPSDDDADDGDQNDGGPDDGDGDDINDGDGGCMIFNCCRK
jgi:hypothetical protein